MISARVTFRAEPAMPVVGQEIRTIEVRTSMLKWRMANPYLKDPGNGVPARCWIQGLASMVLVVHQIALGVDILV